uniref:Uncharacterized protein n=1 Tax=Anopheles darlingi TaxID=43151 RepID=A0A2M4CYW3_ANODA
MCWVFRKGVLTRVRLRTATHTADRDECLLSYVSVCHDHCSFRGAITVVVEYSVCLRCFDSCAGVWPRRARPSSIPRAPTAFGFTTLRLSLSLSFACHSLGDGGLLGCLPLCFPP